MAGALIGVGEKIESFRGDGGIFRERFENLNSVGTVRGGCGAGIRLRCANEDFSEQERREAIFGLKLEDLLGVAKSVFILILIGFDLRAGVEGKRFLGIAGEDFLDLRERFGEFGFRFESDGEADA